MSKGYFSYIRVSTVRQGQTGTSLAEQREAIQRYADRWSLQVVREFEEKETAAKYGRPLFLQMLSALKGGKADGVIIHKIDRGARNLRDWAELGEIIDRGIDVHFANENLDLESRGGRLSADIQAVVAADFIRNLREEVKKGFYGRLKQGFYPMPAPIGYLNKGPAQPKEPDPARAPLVKEAFELYASGRYGINDLVEEMYARGLRGRTGAKVTRNGMAHLLHNPFYVGLVRVKLQNELFAGRHEPIVPKALFDKVQKNFLIRSVKRALVHDFIFRRLLSCSSCQATMIGELQKGHIYYRCHERDCQQKTIREDVVEAVLVPVLKRLCFNATEHNYLRKEIRRRYGNLGAVQETQQQALTLQLDQLRNKLSKLTDAYVDGVVDRQTYVDKKNDILIEERSLTERLANLSQDLSESFRKLEKILELANCAYSSYEIANVPEKREMVESVTSNLRIEGKSVLYKLHYPFQLIAERQLASYGRPYRATARTLSRLLSKLISYAKSLPAKEEEANLDKPVKITPHRLKLAFRSANGSEKLAA